MWPIHTLRSFEACFLGAVGPEVHISQQKFEQGEYSLQSLGFFEPCAFDDYIPKWIFEIPNAVGKGWVLVLDQDQFRDSDDDTDAESHLDGQDTHLACNQEQEEVVVRPRRNSMMSSSSCSVEIITGDEDAIW